MGCIRRLDQQMINIIAAGEVIERPASVIKELMENSIDGGARTITVSVEDGGRKLITVTDDGCGMGPEDLDQAFEAHTTSKIFCRDDLRSIATLGFRGEALASIASVARVSAVSRARDADAAFGIEIDCGNKGDVTPCSSDVGTRIQVRDLFYKLPARWKFLKTASTEMGHIAEQFTRIALAHDALTLHLWHNGKQVHRLIHDQAFVQRVSELFPGLELEESGSLLQTETQEKGMSIKAWLGRPEVSRVNNKYQYIFLNRRFIQDRGITHAIREAYRGLMEPNRYPLVFLFIQMPVDAYDVNVHPTKTEVRFYDSQLVHSQVLGCLRETLLGTNLFVQGSIPIQTPSPARPAGAGQRSGQRVAEAVSDFLRHHALRGDTPRLGFPEASAKDSPTGSRPPASLLEGTRTDKAFMGVQRPFIQIHDTYILAETDTGFILIDQHALHEKILFEKLSRAIQSRPLESQRLLIAQRVPCNEKQAGLIEAHRDLFHTLGIRLEPFGPRTYAVEAFPTLLQNVDPEAFIHDIMDLLAGHGGDLDCSQLLNELLNMAACKAAIKAGRKLSNLEIIQLLQDADLAESSSRCPHGRPTTIRFTLEQLNRQFLRT